MEKEIVTRKELYDLVWSVPLQTLSQKQAIAGVGRGKICVKMEIPLPKVGHRHKGLAAADGGRGVYIGGESRGPRYQLSG